MIFLIEYDRKNGRRIVYEKFKDSEKEKAQKRRQELELDLNRRKINHEVVLLEASRESLLQHTHRRYFESLSTILKSQAKKLL